MEIRNVLERLKLLTNDDRKDLLLMLSGDAVQRLKARLCCTEEEENGGAVRSGCGAGGVSVLAFGGSGIAEKPDGGRGARGI